MITDWGSKNALDLKGSMAEEEYPSILQGSHIFERYRIPHKTVCVHASFKLTSNLKPHIVTDIGLSRSKFLKNIYTQATSKVSPE